MRTRLLNLALLVTLILAASRLWLFLGEPPPALPAITAGATAPAAGSTNSEQKTEVMDLRPEIYDVIVARDLFSATRGVVPSAPAPTSAPRLQPAPKLTLYGVVISDEEKAAYLQEGTQDGRPRKVRENEHFAGGIVKIILPDAIIFSFSGSEIKVPLRAPKFGAESAASRTPAPGGAAVPRPGSPAEFPRRQLPTGVRQGQLPIPGRPAIAPPSPPAAFPGMSSGVPAAEPVGEGFEEEEFPEGSTPAGEDPGVTEEAAP